MKLYLASKHIQFPEELVALVGKSPQDTVVRLVVNAFDNFPADRREIHITNLSQSLSDAGYRPVQIDLRNYTGKLDDLTLELDKADLLWVSGGNVFYLRYVLQQCGLDTLLRSLIDGGMTYGGDSAGAAVLGHDLHGLDLLDDVKEAPVAIYEGLDITPFIVLPHWGNERYRDEIANSKQELQKYNDEIVTISDDQVCIVNGEARQIVG